MPLFCLTGTLPKTFTYPPSIGMRPGDSGYRFNSATEKNTLKVMNSCASSGIDSDEENRRQAHGTD